MQHLAEQKALSKHAVSLMVCTAMVATPASAAYAAPLDEAAKFVSSSPLVTFGLGCAAGAVVGGLVVGLSGKRARRRLQDEIDEVVEAAVRAEESARRAEALLAKYQASQPKEKDVAPRQEEASPAPVGKEVAKSTAVASESVQEAGVRKSSASVEVRAEQEPKASHATDSFATNVLSKDELKQRSAAAKSDAEQRRSHRRGLRGTTGRIMNLPVIDRGAPRSASESPFVTGSYRQRQFDPTVRANLIDRRVPRFDESLFPDTTNELQQDVDVFETAMRAMDATLSGTGVQEQATSDLGHSVDQRPDISDTSSYVEYLVQDELERNRNGAGRRFSRAHLTMFEGTGDLSAARKALQYRPRHMQKATKEA